MECVRRHNISNLFFFEIVVSFIVWNMTHYFRISDDDGSGGIELILYFYKLNSGYRTQLNDATTDQFVSIFFFLHSTQIQSRPFHTYFK